MADTAGRHGTYAGYISHARARTLICPPCAAARTAYQRAYRAALRQLAAEFPARYAEIYKRTVIAGVPSSERTWRARRDLAADQLRRWVQIRAEQEAAAR